MQSEKAMKRKKGRVRRFVASLTGKMSSLFLQQVMDHHLEQTEEGRYGFGLYELYAFKFELFIWKLEMRIALHLKDAKHKSRKV